MLLKISSDEDNEESWDLIEKFEFGSCLKTDLFDYIIFDKVDKLNFQG